jgi:hypothetical protein
LGTLTVKDFETVNMTISANAAGANAFDFVGGVKMTPSAGGQMVWNLTDNNDNNVNFFNAGVNLTPNGVWKIDGAGTGNIVLVAQTVTALQLDASAHTGGGLQMTIGVLNNTIGGGATSAITITGTPLNDVLIGSNFKDTINAGAGNDIVANHANLGTGNPPIIQTTENDQLTLGAGNDRVNLFGDTAGAGGTLVATAKGAIPLVTDFVLATDLFALSTNNNNYNGMLANKFGGINLGGTEVQIINPAGGIQAVSGTADILHLGSFTENAGQTIGQAFAASIGTASVTGFAAGGNTMYFTMFDTTTNQMLIGDVDSGNAVLTSADNASVHLIGTINMAAADYLAFNTASNSFQIIA